MDTEFDTESRLLLFLDTKLNAMLELSGKGRFHAQFFSF